MIELPTGIFGTDISMQRAVFSALPVFGLWMTVQNYIDQQDFVDRFPFLENGASTEEKKDLTEKVIKYLKNWTACLVCGIVSDALTFLAISIACSATGLFAGPIFFFSMQLLCCAGIGVRLFCLIDTVSELSLTQQRYGAGNYYTFFTKSLCSSGCSYDAGL